MLFKLIQYFPWLSKIIHAHDGLIPDIESEKDYIFGVGKLEKKILMPDGQWNKYLPEDEIQRGRYVETMGCTGYGFMNAIEIIAKLKWNVVWNRSDRYTNKGTRTSKRGNSMRNVLDFTRKYIGTVDEKTWSWDRDTFNWSKYYAAIPYKIKEVGKNWLKEYQLGYEKVWCNKQLMMEALKYSPLYISGYAWYQKNGLYRSYGKANHVFVVIGYVEGSHWLIYDSYSPYIKKLDWDFKFGSAYIVLLDKKDKTYNRKKIEELQKKGIKYIQRPLANGEVYKLKNGKLFKVEAQEIKDMTIKDLAVNKKLIGINEEFYNSLIK